jgi:L-aminopeptidase/D-esterase-like protein
MGIGMGAGTEVDLMGAMHNMNMSNISHMSMSGRIGGGTGMIGGLGSAYDDINDGEDLIVGRMAIAEEKVRELSLQ